MSGNLEVRQQALKNAQLLGQVKGKFKFVLLWGRTSSSTFVDRRLTMHGAFRRRLGNKETFEPGSLPDLAKLLFDNLDLARDLERIWPNVHKNEDDGPTKTIDFWFYQWEKHGRWFGLTMFDFFKMVIHIYDFLSLENVGIKCGIPYTVKRLQEKFSAALDFEVSQVTVVGEAGCNEYVTHPKLNVFKEVMIWFSAAMEITNTSNPYTGTIKSVDDIVMFV